jgi:predicted ATPase
MKLVIKKLGSINKKSEIDLSKRFYTFVGYNNSGKTYVSHIIWYLFSEFEMFFKTKEHNIFEQPDLNKLSYNFQIDLSSFSENINSFFQKSSLEEALGLNNHDAKFYVHKDFNNLKYKSYLVILEIANKKVREYYEFIKKTNSNILEIKRKEIEGIITQDDFFKKNNDFDWARTLFLYPDQSKKDQNKSILDILDLIIKEIIIRILILPFNKIYNVFFLPSSRQFIPTYHKYLYEGFKDDRDKISKVIDNPNSKSLIKVLSKKRHTIVVDKLLDKISNLNSKTTVNEYYSDLITDLENIMLGRVSVENVEGISSPEFQFKLDKDTSLEMYQASSSTNQLTILYLYLKYWAEKENNILMIDEPEPHLHPENQIKLLNILVRFANMNNNRVFVTTHSPLVAEMINNYALLSLLNEKGENIEQIIHEHNLDINIIKNLKHNDYITYFFDGEKIKEYQTTEFGVFFEDFKKAEDKIRKISNTLKDFVYTNKKNKNHEKSV